jgi:hypothetical protein
MMKFPQRLMPTFVGFILFLAVFGLWSGCEDPGPIELNTTSISNRVLVTAMSTEPPMNDPRNDIWDKVSTGAITLSGDSLDTAYTGPVYVKAIKAAGRLFVRAEWTDGTRSIHPNGIVYTVSVSGDTITPDTTVAWVQNPSFQIITTVDGKVLYQYDQDRLAIMWNTGDNGTEKADCASMCHTSDQVSSLGHRMYTTGGGHVDVWHWQAATSDPILLAADEYWDAEGRKTDADNGIPMFVSNFNAVDGTPYYQHRDTTILERPFLHADSTAPFSDSVDWESSYEMPGYVLYDEVAGSVADVNAYATFNISYSSARWILLMSRALNTGNTDDVDFSAVPSGDSIQATIAVMHNADRIHAKSAPFYFVFP